MIELIIFPIVFIATSWLAGFWLVEIIFPAWPKVFKIAWGLIGGLLIATLIIFCLALIGNLSGLTIGAGGGLFLLGAGWCRRFNKNKDKKQTHLSFNEKAHLLGLIILWGAV